MKKGEQQELQPMRRLFSFLGNYKKDLWVSCVSSVINKFFDLMPPILTAWFIDVVSGNTPGWISNWLGISEIKSIIIFLGALTFFVFAIESLFEWMFQRGFMRLAQKTQHDLRIQTYAAIQEKEIAFFENQRLGNLMAVLNDDVNQLERFLNDSFNTILQLIILLLFAGTSLLMVSVPLGLLGLIPIPFIIWGSIYYQRKVAPHYREVREQVGALSSRLENNLSGIKVIKSFTTEDYEVERVADASAAYREANYKAIRWNSLYVPLIRIIIAVGFVVTLALGAYWVYQGKGGLTLGSLALFAMMIQRLLWPVTRLGHVFNEFERARASSRRIFTLLESTEQENKATPKAMNGALRGEMEWESASFSYDNGQQVLNNIDLKIKAGEMIGIVGLTGAGKTTMAKLLLKFYDLDNGEIRIDGTSIQDLPDKYLRSQIALVSQEVYLFHGTLRENICYGQLGVSEEQMIAAAKQAELHDFVSTLEKGYDSIIGERGIKLSGGQRQRLSLARALLKNAPILILDEATSAVDTITEKAIQKNLLNVFKSKTSIVIAHRLSTVRQADKIIVLGDGKIVESGTHTELLQLQGSFAELWKIQTGEASYEA